MFLYANHRKAMEREQNLHSTFIFTFILELPFIILNEKQLTWLANGLALVGKL